jgi:DNA cross-link repair 1C protein
MRMYQSLRGEANKDNGSGPFVAYEGPILTGFKCGNAQQPGCLTLDQNVRLHSCEKGTGCSAVDNNTVWIRPILARTRFGYETSEVGIGGGGGDLTQRAELELESLGNIDQLVEL